MQCAEIKEGVRITCVSPSFSGQLVENGLDIPDVFGQSGVIRERSDLHFYITWDNPQFNQTVRGQGWWSEPSVYEVEGSERALHALDKAKDIVALRLQQQEKHADQKRREAHALKYL